MSKGYRRTPDGGQMATGKCAKGYRKTPDGGVRIVGANKREGKQKVKKGNGCPLVLALGFLSISATIYTLLRLGGAL